MATSAPPQPLPLDRIRVVLCGTSHPGNIGAAARAMKVMGLRELVLVDPQEFPNAEATARASGADDILAGARVVDHVDAALEGVAFAVGASARLRHIALPVLSPRQAAGELLDGLVDRKVAVLFGRERTGLLNEEIDRCQALLHIPADEGFSSLNLAAAVQVVCYELRMAALDGVVPRAEPRHVPAAIPRLEGFFAHLEQTLLDIRFLNPEQSTAMMQRLRRLFHRARPDDNEINILRGILSRAQQAAARPVDEDGEGEGGRGR